MNHLREQWAAVVGASEIQYDMDAFDDQVRVEAFTPIDMSKVDSFDAEGNPMPPEGTFVSGDKWRGNTVGTLEVIRDDDDPRAWFVQLIEVDPGYRNRGIATGMLMALHKKFPSDLILHGNFSSSEGQFFALKMVRQYPGWNQIHKDGSMGTPSVGFPEGFVFTPPLYRSMLSPGQRVIISHPDMEGAEVGGIITGEIPTAGIMVVRLDGMKAPNVVHIPLSMVRVALSSNDPEKWKLKQDAWSRKRPSVKQAKQVGKFTLHYHPYVPFDKEFHTEFDITVTEGDKVVGSFFFAHDGNSFQGAMEVHPDYRRQGIATAAYSWAEQLSGYKLDPSYPHSEMAESFWSQPGRPFG